MKHLTIVFTKIVAGLCQQGIFSQAKRNNLVSEWRDGVTNSDMHKLDNLLSEIKASTDNNTWRAELNNLREELYTAK